MRSIFWHVWKKRLRRAASLKWVTITGAMLFMNAVVGMVFSWLDQPFTYFWQCAASWSGAFIGWYAGWKETEEVVKDDLILVRLWIKS